MLTGELEWNLTQSTSHAAGEALNVTFKITNPTANERQYKIYIGLFDLAGPVITTWPLPDTFVVPGESEQSITIGIEIDYSNCIMQASLYDIETGEMGAALQTVLEQPPSPIEQISPAITAVVGIAALGMIVSIIPGMLKG